MQFNWNFFGRLKGSDSAPYTCERVQRLLSLYVDSMASNAERNAIDAHISGCVTCREQSACLRSIHQVVSSRPVAEPPSDLRMRIAQAIAAERAPVRTAPRIGFSYGVLAGAAALVVCFAAVGLQVERMQVAQKPHQTPVLDAQNVVNPVVNPDSIKRLHIGQPSLKPTKIAASIVPEDNNVSSDRIHQHVNEVERAVVLKTKPITHAEHSDRVLLAANPVVTHVVLVHHVVSVAHTLVAANTHRPLVAPVRKPIVVAFVPRNDQQIAAPTPNLPSPAVVQPAITAVVASAPASVPEVRTADLISSVRVQVKLSLLKRGDEIPSLYRAVHTSGQTTSGIVPIVQSPFN